MPSLVYVILLWIGVDNLAMACTQAFIYNQVIKQKYVIEVLTLDWFMFLYMKLKEKNEDWEICL